MTPLAVRVGAVRGRVQSPELLRHAKSGMSNGAKWTRAAYGDIIANRPRLYISCPKATGLHQHNESEFTGQ